MRHSTTKLTAVKLCATVFALALLMVGVVSNLRSWRRLQVEFYALEREHVQAKLAAAQEPLAPQLEEVRGAVAAERQTLDGQKAEAMRLEEGLRTLRRKEERARIRLEDARYAFETAQEDGAEEARAAWRDARRELEAWQEEVAAQGLALDHLSADLRAAAGREEALVAPLRPLVERAAQLERGASRRAWPFLGLFEPMVAPQEVLLEALPLQSGVPRVDRCLTCHLGAPTSGLEEFPAPFSSHPRLDLFVAEGSAHPYAEVGCTTCHGGEGRATAFDRAGHLPQDDEQEAVWRQRWGFRREHLPLHPILPTPLVQAGCAGCHRDGQDLPAAHTLDAGRRLGRRLGCGACHPTVADDLALPQRGPSLAGLATRTQPQWVARFLAAPGDFRSTTWMPHGFDLENAAEGERKRQEAEIHAMVTYLWEHSGGPAWKAPPTGDPEVGRALFGRVGCSACHVLDPEAIRADFAPRFERLQGPNLARTGNKMDAAWLFTWLRDPKAHRPDSPMPNLRLSKQEAAALTAFLMAQNDPAWESTEQAQQLPPPEAGVRDQLVLEHLEASLSLRESAERFEALEDRERTLYLGERALIRHGCHGCHKIPGFEETPPPAVPLPILTSQAVASRPEAWHVTAPSTGSQVAAPRYNLSAEERISVTTWLLSTQRPKVPGGALPAEPILASGQRLIDRYGCRGCHEIEGWGGVPNFGEGPSRNPPTLVGEGRRVRPSWLLAFLHDPGAHPVRPWLELRMPTFALRDQQFEDLARYFAERDHGRDGLLETPPSSSSNLERAAGAVFFDLLQCDHCHYGRESGGLQVPEFAPSYHLASRRLRAPWAEEWILDPTRHRPGTSMPGLMKEGEEAFLLRSLDAPMFIGQKARLLRVFDGEEALAAFLEDPRRVAQALRVHIWSLGEREPVR